VARLSKDDWTAIRQQWEADQREGFDWLANDINGAVSRQAISKMAKKQGWSKGGEKVAQPKESCATKRERISKVAQPKTQIATKPKPMTIVEDDPDQFGTLDQLTDKQEVFVREYMVDWNATQAAIRAGYSADTANQIGYQLLHNPSVSDAPNSKLLKSIMLS